MWNLCNQNTATAIVKDLKHNTSYLLLSSRYGNDGKVYPFIIR